MSPTLIETADLLRGAFIANAPDPALDELLANVMEPERACAGIHPGFWAIGLILGTGAWIGMFHIAMELFA